MTPEDDVGDGERMVFLPEIVGEKGFLESTSLTFRIDSSRKTHAGGPLLGSRLEAEGRNVLWMSGKNYTSVGVNIFEKRLKRFK
ncbi:hypothetical protein TNCV_1037431 [Trichonephila clavipes]|nr:hypothetical protein TNCV_1037431 [Trichonephila clavipes]